MTAFSILVVEAHVCPIDDDIEGWSALQPSLEPAEVSVAAAVICKLGRESEELLRAQGLVAHDCGYPLSRYTCRATRVAADFLDFIAFCRCSTGVALHPLKILMSHLPPLRAGRCRTEVWV